MEESTERTWEPPSRWRWGLVLFQLIALGWMVYNGYSLHRSRKALENRPPPASSSIQILSSDQCKHTLEVEERKDGKLINRAYQCKDEPEVQTH